MYISVENKRQSLSLRISYGTRSFAALRIDWGNMHDPWRKAYRKPQHTLLAPVLSSCYRRFTGTFAGSSHATIGLTAYFTMNGPHGPSPLSGRATVKPATASSTQKRIRSNVQQRTKKKQLTPRQIEMAKSLKTRKEWDDRVFEWQQRLFDGAVDSEVLAEAVCN